MTQLDQTKLQAITLLKNICAKCKGRVLHTCPVSKVIEEVQGIKGIPVIVNDNLYHVVFN